MNYKCAFDYHGDCVALREKQCKGCSFYKTEEELNEGRKKAARRLVEVDDAERIMFRKYYSEGSK